MNRSLLVLLVSIGALAGSAAVALGHSTPHAWTASKARVMLQEGTNVGLPPDQRQALDAELASWVAKFQPLLLTAETGAQLGLDPTPGRLAQTYKSYIDRLKKLRGNVNSGLSIDSVKCVGQGNALTGKRYRHFRCNATSYVLEIPSIELVPGTDPALPEVVEGPRRLIGPLAAVFNIHVTGKSRMLSQRTA